VVVETVGEDALPGGVVGRVAIDEGVEGPAGVEQARPQLALGLDGHPELVGLRIGGDAECVLEPQRWVEGHDQGVETGHRRIGPHGRGQGRLADPAGAHDDGQRRAHADLS
jgi:hypothetical protein